MNGEFVVVSALLSSTVEVFCFLFGLLAVT